MQIFSAPLELKRSAPTGEGIFVGLASTFNRIDRNGDTIIAGAYAATLTEWNQRGGKIPILWQHDMAEPVGGVQSALETPAGLEITGKLALNEVSNARRAFDLMQVGGVSLSIGYTIPVGGAELRKSDGVRVLRKIDVHEISIVSVPADGHATIREVKNAKGLEELLREHAGMSERTAKRFITGGRAALAVTTIEDDESEHATIAALAARVESFTKLLRNP